MVGAMKIADEVDALTLAVLDLVDRDIRANPERIRLVPQTLLDRARDLTRGVEVDLAKRLEAGDE